MLEVLQTLEEEPEENPELMIRAKSGLAYIYRARGRNDEAERLYLETIPAARQSPKLVKTQLPRLLNNLAFLLRNQERYIEALPYYQEALDLNTRNLGERHPSTRQVLTNLVALHAKLKQFDEAEELLRRNIRVSEEIHPQGHWRIGQSHGSLGRLLLVAGRAVDARPLLERQAAIFRRALGSEHEWTASAEAELALCFLALGEHDKHRRLLAHCDRILSGKVARRNREVRADMEMIAEIHDQYGFHQRGGFYRGLISSDTSVVATQK
jgi:tetratricopeptide (TPR) repeat protein